MCNYRLIVVIYMYGLPIYVYVSDLLLMCVIVIDIIYVNHDYMPVDMLHFYV